MHMQGCMKSKENCRRLDAMEYQKVWGTVKVDVQPVISNPAIKAERMFYKKNERASNLASRARGEKMGEQ
jgi:hypothetical protein